MTTLKSLQIDMDDLNKQADNAKTESERLAALAISYDANGVPDKADLHRDLAARKALEAASFKSNAETKQSELDSIQAQVAKIDEQIQSLKNERDRLQG